MISLAALAELAARHPGLLDTTVAPLRLGDELVDTDSTPAVMGTVNLSRDSTYRESIAVSTEAALRKARVMAAEGAHLVDVGAESTTARAARVTSSDQLLRLRPLVKDLAAERIRTSVETYDPQVAAACLEAGAVVVNYTGRSDETEMYRVVADHGATLVLCYVAGDDVRRITDAPGGDPFDALLDHFARRVELARSAGVEHLVVDPGMGFYYGNLTDPSVRAAYQARVLLNTFRLRGLGLPVCHALPHAFDLFEENFRVAEGFFAVLAHLGRTGLYRTHEVPQVRAVLRALRLLGTDFPPEG